MLRISAAQAGLVVDNPRHVPDRYWVSAQEALVAARQVSEKTDAEDEAVDIAGSRLVVAVMRWRSSRVIGSHRAARSRCA